MRHAQQRFVVGLNLYPKVDPAGFEPEHICPANSDSLTS
jgi:hypothetical protein